MTGTEQYARSVRLIQRYLIFFIGVAFVVSCTTILFVTTLSKTLGVVLTAEHVQIAAKITFANVLFLTSLILLIDYFRRKFTVERATKQIAEAAKKIVAGNFQVRVAPVGYLGDRSFNEVITCFNQLAEELSGVETLRTDFIANVSHEMRTPLAVMQQYATLLQEPNLSEEKRLEYTQIVADGAKRLSDMMTNILKLNRLENQTIYPEVTTFHLGEQLAACLLDYESIWEEKQIVLDVALQEAVCVSADKELLSLVWNNLFSNAFKFTPEGGQVTVRLFVNEDNAIVQVQDTGCGISKATGAHIFEKFYQGDTSHATQGNGLGLALVKRVVDILQGEIHVESTVGVGSTFTVILPQTSTGGSY